ncbi:MAG: selenium-dependent molybdenum cofactor biosynthesis protein YqeB [Pseudomonadota bacterium]
MPGAIKIATNISNAEPLSNQEIPQTKVLIRGGGDMASGVAYLLFKNGFKVFLTELACPLAIRRMVSFCEAVFDGEKTVEGVTALRVSEPKEAFSVWEMGKIPLLVDPENRTKNFLKPHVLIDATMAKRNVGTMITDAPLVIGLGPGFKAGKDVHVVIETNQGSSLGKIIFEGEAEPDNRIPEIIAGFGEERVIRAPRDGIWKIAKDIGAIVTEGEIIAWVEGEPVKARLSGIIRGMLRDGTKVTEGLKAGEVDPRGEMDYCTKIFDKAISLGNAVMDAILSLLPKNLLAEEV